MDKRITLKLPPALHRRLKIAAAKSGETLAALIERLLNQDEQRQKD